MDPNSIQNSAQCNDQYEDCGDYQEYNMNEYEGYDNYDISSPIDRVKSTNKPYNLCEKQTLLMKIQKQIDTIAMFTAFQYGWNFQLYYEGQFNMDYVKEILDGRHKKLIHYREDFKESIQNGQCDICMCEGELYANPCGHSYCFYCWKGYLETNVQDRTLYQIMPKCQDQECQQKMHYSIISKCLKSDEKFIQKFNSLLCSKYCRQSKSVKMCTTQNCGKIIYINTFSQVIIICSCNNWICTFCGKPSHFPVNCSDNKNWNKIQVNHKNTWLASIDSKPCPFCKEPIIKNGGCNHMSCKYPSCMQQFCWICLKKWQGHSDQGCSKANNQWEKQKQKMTKDISKYTEKVEQTKSMTETFQNRITRLKRLNLDEIKNELSTTFKILAKDLDFLDDIIDILPKTWNYGKWAAISKFFQRQMHQMHQVQSQELLKMSSRLDQFLDKFVPQLIKDWKYMKKNQGKQGHSLVLVEDFANKFLEEKNKILPIRTEVISYMNRLISN